VSTPGVKKAREDSQSCTPVTLRILQDAAMQRGDNGELRVHGIEATMLLLVGTVETLARSLHSLEFSLNDGTGRMQARYYTNDSSTDKELADVEPGRYVSVVGSVRTAPSVHLAVTCMRLIDSPDEICYHLIEVAHAALKLKKSTVEPATPNPERRASATEITPEKVTASSEDIPMPQSLAAQEVIPAAPAASVKPSTKLEGPALLTAVLDFLRKEGEGKQEGVALAAITRHLASNEEQEINELMKKLVDEGEVFCTTDDEHFLAL